MTHFIEAHPYDILIASGEFEERKSHFCPYVDLGNGKLFAESHWYLIVPNGDRPNLLARRMSVPEARACVAEGQAVIWPLGVGWLHTSRLHRDLTRHGALAPAMREFLKQRRYGEDGKVDLTEAGLALECAVVAMLADLSYAQVLSETYVYETQRMQLLEAAGVEYPGPMDGHADPRAVNRDYRP